jgi:hypothetical protein
MEEATAWIERHRRFWNQQLDALSAFLAHGPAHTPAKAKAPRRRRPYRQ